MTTENEKYRRAQARVRKLRSFYTSIVTYVFVNILLVIINLLSSPHHLWFYWVTIIWGVVLLAQAFNTFTIRDRLLGDEWEEKKIEELMNEEKPKKKTKS